MYDTMRYKMTRAAELNGGSHSYEEAPQHVRDTIEAEIRQLRETMKTADRQPIVEGMRVFTNNLDRGVVSLADLDFEYHAGQRRWVPWFDVIIDTDYKGNPATGKVLQSDDRVAARFEGKSA